MTDDQSSIGNKEIIEGIQMQGYILEHSDIKLVINLTCL